MLHVHVVAVVTVLTTMLCDVIVVVDVMWPRSPRSMLLCMHACGSVSISYGAQVGGSSGHWSSVEKRKYTENYFNVLNAN